VYSRLGDSRAVVSASLLCRSLAQGGRLPSISGARVYMNCVRHLNIACMCIIALYCSVPVCIESAARYRCRGSSTLLIYRSKHLRSAYGHISQQYCRGAVACGWCNLADHHLPPGCQVSALHMVGMVDFYAHRSIARQLYQLCVLVQRSGAES
jgi:hypothetical protein